MTIDFYANVSVRSQLQKQFVFRKGLDIFHFVEIFPLIIFGIKTFLVGLTNDSARVKTLENIKLLESIKAI